MRLTPRTTERSTLILLLLAILGAGCAARQEIVERPARGPRADELFTARSYVVNGRAPSFDERRMWEDRLEDRVTRYLREHREIEQTPRYSDVRFWRQVGVGSPREEVRILLEEPDERTVDPARMGALAKGHWARIQEKASEAWVYVPGWVLFFDDGGVVDIVRRLPRREAGDD